MSWPRGVLAIALLGLSASCTSSSTTTSSDATTISPVPTTTLDPTTPVANAPPTSAGSRAFVPRWTHTGVGMSNSFLASSGDIVLANDEIVFVADGFGGAADQYFVTAVDAHTGEVLWRRDDLTPGAPGEDVFLQSRVDSILVVNGQYMTVTAVDTATGSIIWSFDLPEGYGAVRSRVADGNIIIAAEAPTEGDTRPPRIYALDVETGELAWMTRLAKGTDLQWQSPPISDGLVFVSSTIDHPDSADGNMVHALDVSTGQIAWSADLEGEQGFSFSPALVADGVIATNSNHVGAVGLNTSNGEKLWIRPDVSLLALSSDEQFIAFGTAGVISLDPRSGDETLLIDAADIGTIPDEARLLDGVLVVTERAWVEGYDLESGRRLWRIDVATTNAPIAFANDFLVAPTSDPIGIAVFDIP